MTRGEGDRDRLRLDPEACEAVVLDMDGVLTDTARVHARAWKQAFDAFLERWSRERGEEQPPFDVEKDYPRYVDGVPRYDGVRRFLASRGIELEEGAPDDAPGLASVHALGNRKNELFLSALLRDGAERFEDAVAFVHRLERAGIRTAVLSASRNAVAVLEAAGLADLFETRVDGVVRRERGLRGKPDPDVFLEAARRLGAAPERTAVVEDAVAGIEAGRAGGFRPVIGVARRGGGRALAEAGADVVVRDLSAIEVAGAAEDRDEEGGPIDALPSALDRIDDLLAAVAGSPLAVFLDFDGTLSPIVDRPEDARLADGMPEALGELAARCRVAVVSGRDLDDLRGRVAVEGVVCAGCHGFRLDAPADGGVEREEARASLPALDRAEAALAEAFAGRDGVQVERKRFAVAVHHRRAPELSAAEVREEVERTVGEDARLRITGGRKIVELRPAVDWDKGRALRWILETLGPAPDEAFALYVGDDLTDEDAFRALETGSPRGVGIVVRGREGRTRARYALDDCDAVRRFLGELARRGGAR